MTQRLGLKLSLFVILLALFALPSDAIFQDGQNNTQVEEASGDESYLLLSDDEIVQNPELLNYLSQASKEDVEEIVDTNPAIQDKLLKRVDQVVHLREVKNKQAGRPNFVLVGGKNRPINNIANNYPPGVGPPLGGPFGPLAGPQVRPYGGSLGGPIGGQTVGPVNLSPIGMPISAPGLVQTSSAVAPDGSGKLATLRKKLEGKTIKLFKIGSKFRKKLMRYQNRGRKKRKPCQKGKPAPGPNGQYVQVQNGVQNQPCPPRQSFKPNFHFEINSSK